jgi:glycosyltransferase involved in cell wall biosynthesis
VLFLGYNFGLPVVATDVGSLTEEIVEGRTGYVCRPRDPVDLAGKLCAYFASDLYEDLPRRRRDIESYAVERYSWSGIGQSTAAVYRRLVGHG